MNPNPKCILTNKASYINIENKFNTIIGMMLKKLNIDHNRYTHNEYYKIPVINIPIISFISNYMISLNRYSL